MKTYSTQQIKWLHDNYFHLDAEELAWNYNNIFHQEKSGKTLQRKCYNDGLRKQCLGINSSFGKIGMRESSTRWTEERKKKMLISRYGLINYLMKGYKI